jgi:hypothetical protein
LSSAKTYWLCGPMGSPPAYPSARNMSKAKYPFQSCQAGRCIKLTTTKKTAIRENLSEPPMSQSLLLTCIQFGLLSPLGPHTPILSFGLLLLYSHFSG